MLSVFAEDSRYAHRFVRWSLFPDSMKTEHGHGHGLWLELQRAHVVDMRIVNI